MLRFVAVCSGGHGGLVRVGRGRSGKVSRSCCVTVSRFVVILVRRSGSGVVRSGVMRSGVLRRSGSL